MNNGSLLQSDTEVSFSPRKESNGGFGQLRTKISDNNFE